MATRFSATAGAIGLVGGALAALPAGPAVAAALPAHVPSAFAALPAGAVAVTGAAVPVSAAPMPAPAPQQRGLVPAAAPAGVQPQAAVAAQHAATAEPRAEHAAPAKPGKRRASQPFHKTGLKARSLPDTGVPLSTALGAVTALTALLAGIGTVLAARRPHRSGSVGRR